jgi:hypothetical protein
MERYMMIVDCNAYGPGSGVKPKPKIKRLHSWGGQARSHDYEMTDGTIETLTETEAEQRR